MNEQELSELRNAIQSLISKGYRQTLPPLRPEKDGQEIEGEIHSFEIRKDKSRKTFALRARVKVGLDFAVCSIPNILGIGEKIRIRGASFIPQGETKPIMFWRFAGTVAGSQEQQSQQQGEPSFQPPKTT